ncbi:MAG: hypothetical protein M5R37_09675 [Melioribacteraceae bacterium]|nr:hypothetical protein [Melioribacteraceae bacterium]
MNLIFFLNLDTEALIDIDDIKEFLFLSSNQKLPYKVNHIFIIHQKIKASQKSLLEDKKTEIIKKYSKFIAGTIKFYRFDPYSDYKIIVSLIKGSLLFFIVENYCEAINKVLDKLLQNGFSTGSIKGIAFNFFSHLDLREIDDYEYFLGTYNLLYRQKKDQDLRSLKPDSLFKIISKNNAAYFIKAKTYKNQLLIIRSSEDCIVELIKRDYSKMGIQFLQYDNPTSLEKIPTKSNNLILTNINPIQNPELIDLRNYLFNHGYFSKKVLLHFQDSKNIIGFEDEIQNYLLDIYEFGNLSIKKAEILFAMYSFIYDSKVEYYKSVDYDVLLEDNKFYITFYDYLLDIGKAAEFDTTFWYNLGKKIQKKSANHSLEERIQYARTRENYLIKFNGDWEIRYNGRKPIKLKDKAGIRYLAEIFESRETNPDKIYEVCNPTKKSKDAFTAIRKSFQKDLKDYLNKISVSTDLLNYLFKTGESLIYFNDSEKKIEIRDKRRINWEIIK